MLRHHLRGEVADGGRGGGKPGGVLRGVEEGRRVKWVKVKEGEEEGEEWLKSEAVQVGLRGRRVKRVEEGEEEGEEGLKGSSIQEGLKGDARG